MSISKKTVTGCFRACPSPSAAGFALSTLLVLALITACSGGGGGGGGESFDTAGSLLSVEFPDPTDVNSEVPDKGPRSAPLNQQIVLSFSGRPSPDVVNSQTIQIRDVASGFPVPGTFAVAGTMVTFTPQLPLTEPEQLTGTSYDVGGAGLEPGHTYSVRVGTTTWSFISSIDPDLLLHHPDPSGSEDVFVTFQTSIQPGTFLRGLARQQPRLVSSAPVDGATGVTPQLYSDPLGAFPPRESFHLVFDSPVNPSVLNIDNIQLIDLDDRPTEHPAGLPLGAYVRVLENAVDHAVVEVEPSGILPFGHLLSLEVPALFRGISMTSDSSGGGHVIAATFTIAAAPDSVSDALVEDFDASARREPDFTQIPVGQVPAEWDRRDSNVLQAGFAFDGQGELGRLIPNPPASGEDARTVILDTSSQSFPLLDGSTPDAPPGTVIVGGVFPFTDIDIPDGIIIEARGPNPLVLNATGSVRIAGKFSLEGQPGGDDNAFDSAITSVPGGPAGSGGGRGGEGHPIHWVGAAPTNLNLVSPPTGGRGFGPRNMERVGGGGGQSGMIDREDQNGDYITDLEISCSEVTNNHNNGYKPPGGGGGSFLQSGTEPLKNGWGNVITDGQGTWIVRTKYEPAYRSLTKGAAGDPPFSDADTQNDFIGIRGERQDVFGGQGGGSGGSALDSFYCGSWCFSDADASNDSVCVAEFGFPPSFAGSVGDSRGGSGGGAGGALMIKALGEILMLRTSRIDAFGANGGGGEALGCGNWGGCGGGGSGGAVILQSADSIELKNNAKINVRGGQGKYAVKSQDYITSCSGRAEKNRGSGGHGGHGIIQLQVPFGEYAIVIDPSDLTPGAWVDQNNTLNPSEFSSVSVAQSTWYDMGRVIERAPDDTNPVWAFSGTDPATGQVKTTLEGYVIGPNDDLRCDYLGQLDPLNPGEYLDGEEPRSDFIPRNASVAVHFQGAHAIAEGSKEPDLSTATSWVTDISMVNSLQFVRYRVLFNLLERTNEELSPTTPRPAVQLLQMRAEF